MKTVEGGLSPLDERDYKMRRIILFMKFFFYNYLVLEHQQQH